MARINEAFTLHSKLVNFYDEHTDLQYSAPSHYLPLDGMVNIPIYLVWASWVRNGTTFQNDKPYFEIQT